MFRPIEEELTLDGVIYRVRFQHGLMPGPAPQVQCKVNGKFVPAGTAWPAVFRDDRSKICRKRGHSNPITKVMGIKWSLKKERQLVAIVNIGDCWVCACMPKFKERFRQYLLETNGEVRGCLADFDPKSLKDDENVILRLINCKDASLAKDPFFAWSREKAVRFLNGLEPHPPESQVPNKESRRYRR